MAGDYHHTNPGAFKGYIPIYPRPLTGSQHQANSEVTAPGYAHAVTMQKPAVNPGSRDLRLTCDGCRLLHRRCPGGSPSKPCERCDERKVPCVFRPYGSSVEKGNRKRKRDSTAEQEPQVASNKKEVMNGTVPAPGFDPTALGLRRRCNYCHLRARACVNGSDTTPCDNCKQRNLICSFGARKSIVNKETFRTITDEDYTQQHNLSKMTDENYNQEYNDVAVARPSDIKEQQPVEVEEVEVGEPKVGMFMVRGIDGEIISFSQDDLHDENEHLMHPWEIFDARNKLVYDLHARMSGL